MENGLEKQRVRVQIAARRGCVSAITLGRQLRSRKQESLEKPSHPCARYVSRRGSRETLVWNGNYSIVHAFARRLNIPFNLDGEMWKGDESIRESIRADTYWSSIEILFSTNMQSKLSWHFAPWLFSIDSFISFSLLICFIDRTKRHVKGNRHLHGSRGKIGLSKLGQKRESLQQLLESCYKRRERIFQCFERRLNLQDSRGRDNSILYRWTMKQYFS